MGTLAWFKRRTVDTSTTYSDTFLRTSHQYDSYRRRGDHLAVSFRTKMECRQL